MSNLLTGIFQIGKCKKEIDLGTNANEKQTKQYFQVYAFMPLN